MFTERESSSCLLSWCRVNGTIDVVQEMERPREGVAFLLNDVWHSATINFGSDSSRILWIKFKFSKFVWWWGTASIKDGMKKGRDYGMTCTRLWID